MLDNTNDQNATEIERYIKTVFLFGKYLLAKKVPNGIESIVGVKKAIPIIPNLLFNRMINLFFLVNFFFVFSRMRVL